MVRNLNAHRYNAGSLHWTVMIYYLFFKSVVNFLLNFQTVDSTDSVLCVALIHLAKFKEVQTNAYLEARRVIGQDYDNALSIADIDKLKYIDMVIKESMRRITPTPVIARKVGKDLNLGEFCNF